LQSAMLRIASKLNGNFFCESAFSKRCFFAGAFIEK